MESQAPLQAHAARIRALLEMPPASAPANRRRGGLSPAASRRVQLFAEANLHRPVRRADLAARAALSAFHFARAFKTSMDITPARLARAAEGGAGAQRLLQGLGPRARADRRRHRLRLPELLHHQVPPGDGFHARAWRRGKPGEALTVRARVEL